VEELSIKLFEKEDFIMPKKQLFMFLFLLIILVAFSGCATSLQSYQPKSSEEVRIKELLLKWENTYNNHDVAGNLATWNDKAQIMYGSERKIASKKEYANILPERIKAIPSLNLGTPDIKISGDKAEVSTTLSARGSQILTVFHLIKENNIWSIMSWKY
jgi:hypothetical protein